MHNHLAMKCISYPKEIAELEILLACHQYTVHETCSVLSIEQCIERLWQAPTSLYIRVSIHLVLLLDEMYVICFGVSNVHCQHVSYHKYTLLASSANQSSVVHLQSSMATTRTDVADVPLQWL